MYPVTRERRHRQHGLTLVELVLAIVIISIAVTGVLMAYVTMISRSADPVIDVQAGALAEAYMDEILSKPVSGAASEGTRATFGNVTDYNGVDDSPPVNQNSVQIGTLSAYRVQVATSAVTLAGAPMTQVQVTVTHAGSGRNVVLRAHKVDF
jgi:MSHA pilin protein MshD